MLLLASLGVVANCVYAACERTSGTACYIGPIGETSNRQFFAGVAATGIKRLVITSSGGEVEAGIELGRWVFEQGLDIEVDGYCLSSCANYVFPAARRKVIRPGAVVAWHGNYHHLQHTGLWRDDVARRMEREGENRGAATRYIRGQVERLVELERAFFQLIDVDQRLCWVGKIPPYSVPNYYFLSVRDMARFGVDKVRAPPAYPATDVSGLGSQIEYIELPYRARYRNR